MASFMTELWTSIFTAGPTPTLLIATNVAFGSLQLVLGLLLFATQSIHFAILSVLCGGLWAAINWFAKELRAVQAEEAKQQQQQEENAPGRAKGGSHNGQDQNDADADDEGEETEVEGREGSVAGAWKAAEGPQRTGAVSSGRQSQMESSSVKARGGNAQRQLTADEDHRSGDVSTDSEWEKVEPRMPGD